jgi:LysM repeat protein
LAWQNQRWIREKHCLPGRSSAGAQCDVRSRPVKQWHAVNSCKFLGISSRDEFRKSRHFPRILLIVAVTAFGGCGPQIVQPGGSKSLPPAAIGGQPAANLSSDGSIVGLQQVPQVSASQVVSLPEGGGEAYYHEVKPGETLSAIARTYQTTPERLLDANGLDRTAVLQPGQLIYIPR